MEEIREAATAALQQAESTDHRVVTLAEAILALADELERHNLA
jgi:hypothetical protein